MITVASARRRERPVSLQANYNIISRQIEMETVPFLRRFNVALMCYSPLAGGVLTGKYRGVAEIPEGFRAKRHRKMRAYLEDPLITSIVDELQAIARESSLSMNQLAILWLKAKPHATTIILGGTAPEHFSTIYDVQDATLDPEIVERIDALSAPRIYAPFENQPIAAGAPLG
jgi:aryl-alcohol dehydrogenase-like predicted oxidoreductase